MLHLRGPDRTGLEAPEVSKLQVLLVAAELPFGVLMTRLRATTRARLQHSCALLRAESFLLFPYSSCGPSPADPPPLLPRCWVGGGLSPGRPTVTQSGSIWLYPDITRRWKHLRASLTSLVAHRSNNEEF